MPRVLNVYMCMLDQTDRSLSFMLSGFIIITERLALSAFIALVNFVSLLHECLTLNAFIALVIFVLE